MSKIIKVSETLEVEVETGHDAHLAVDRHAGGRVRIETNEVGALIEALAEAAGLLAEAEAQRLRRQWVE